MNLPPNKLTDRKRPANCLIEKERSGALTALLNILPNGNPAEQDSRVLHGVLSVPLASGQLDRSNACGRQGKEPDDPILAQGDIHLAEPKVAPAKSLC